MVFRLLGRVLAGELLGEGGPRAVSSLDLLWSAWGASPGSSPDGEGEVSCGKVTGRQRLTHLLAENTLLVVPNTGVTSLVTAGVYQASLVGPAVVKY